MCRVENPSEVDLETLNREITAVRRRESLAYSARVLLWTWDENDTLDRPLRPVVLSAAKFRAKIDLGAAENLIAKGIIQKLHDG